MVTGLEPRQFKWVITNRLAVSERVGGYGFQHRRVRRTEEITWIKNAGVTAVLSLLGGGQNLASYEEDGLDTHQVALTGDYTDEDVRAVLESIHSILQADPRTVLLVHRDIVDDTVAGLLGGYLVYSGLIEDPIVATSVIQEIVGRPLGPEGRRLVPQKAAS